MPLPNKNPKTATHPKKGDNAKPLNPTKTTTIPGNIEKTKSTKPAEKTTTSPEDVACNKFPTDIQEILNLVKPDEKKRCVENYDAHIGFVAGVKNGTTVSIMTNGFMSKEECAKDGIPVRKSDIGKDGRKYTYFRFVFRQKTDPEKDKDKKTEDIEFESMAKALFSNRSSSGAWIFIPKRNITKYVIRHAKRMDTGGIIIPPVLSDFANIFSADQSNMRGNEIAFDKIEVKDIQYFATTHEYADLDKLDELGEYVASYDFFRCGNKTGAKDDSKDKDKGKDKGKGKGKDQSTLQSISLVKVDTKMFGKGEDRRTFTEKEKYKRNMVHIYKNKTYDDPTKTSTDTGESTDSE